MYIYAFEFPWQHTQIFQTVHVHVVHLNNVIGFNYHIKIYMDYGYEDVVKYTGKLKC